MKLLSHWRSWSYCLIGDHEVIVSPVILYCSLQRSCREQYCITEPFQPADFNLPKKRCGNQNHEFQSKWFSVFPWLHKNEQSDSAQCLFTCNKMQNQIFELPEVRTPAYLRVFKPEKRRCRDSRCIRVWMPQNSHWQWNKPLQNFRKCMGNFQWCSKKGNGV